MNYMELAFSIRDYLQNQDFRSDDDGLKLVLISSRITASVNELREQEKVILDEAVRVISKYLNDKSSENLEQLEVINVKLSIDLLNCHVEAPWSGGSAPEGNSSFFPVAASPGVLGAGAIASSSSAELSLPDEVIGAPAESSSSGQASSSESLSASIVVKVPAAQECLQILLRKTYSNMESKITETGSGKDPTLTSSCMEGLFSDFYCPGLTDFPSEKFIMTWKQSSKSVQFFNPEYLQKNTDGKYIDSVTQQVVFEVNLEPVYIASLKSFMLCLSSLSNNTLTISDLLHDEAFASAWNNLVSTAWSPPSRNYYDRLEQLRLESLRDLLVEPKKSVRTNATVSTENPLTAEQKNEILVKLFYKLYEKIRLLSKYSHWRKEIRQTSIVDQDSTRQPNLPEYKLQWTTIVKYARNANHPNPCSLFSPAGTKTLEVLEKMLDEGKVIPPPSQVLDIDTCFSQILATQAGDTDGIVAACYNKIMNPRTAVLAHPR